MPDAASPPEFWHRRYLQQARWTAALRERAIQLASLPPGARVLEVGSGTGVIASDLRRRTGSRLYGIDIDLSSTRFAKRTDELLCLSVGAARGLPFPSSLFDAVVCHFLLLWIANPLVVINEMVRVTRPGGWVLCLAEPDYGGRVDYPPEMAELGKLQSKSLRHQGADPYIGRRLRELLTRAGLAEVRAGVLGAEWAGPPSDAETASEWATLESDLKGLMSAGKLAELRQVYLEIAGSRTQVLFVPTFFGFGRRPG